MSIAMRTLHLAPSLRRAASSSRSRLLLPRVGPPRRRAISGGGAAAAGRWGRVAARHASLSVLIAAFSSGTSATTAALCEGGGGGDGDDGDGEDALTRLRKILGEGGADVGGRANAVAERMGSKAAEVAQSGVPTQLSYGFVCGFCSGYALKKVGKAAAVVFGLGFMTLQTLNYSGYIEIDHDALKKEVTDLMDLNEDGSVDEKDIARATDKITEIMSFGLPSGCGFGVGFWGGFRYG